MAKMTIDELKVKKMDLLARKDAFLKTCWPSTFKSKYVSCIHCGSKIRKDLYDRLRCPACNGLYITDSTKARIESFEKRFDKINYQIRKAEYEETHKTTCKQRAVDHELIKNIYDFNCFSYDREIDIGYDFFIDDAICISLVKNASKENTINDKYGSVISEYPYFLIEHEEEKYGNDTHGWCASYNNGNGSTDYVCSKEVHKEIAIEKCKHYFQDHFIEIKKDFSQIKKENKS